MSRLLRWLASYRLRFLVRAAFVLLALAIVALALDMLQEEKQLSYRNYRASFLKTQAQIVAQLRHPSGQLALLNPHWDAVPVTPLHPLILPFSAIDFDDQNKVQQAVEMSGCLVQYPNHGGVCVAVGNNPWAGGFVYVAGHVRSPDWVAHARGERDLSLAHRARVAVHVRGQTQRWIAPFEADAMPEGQAKTRRLREGLRGRLTGFVDLGTDVVLAKPVKDFRGWVWQSPVCDAGGVGPQGPECWKTVFFSLRLPVTVLRDALFAGDALQWPPPDLNQMQVEVQMLPPGHGPALLDSNSHGAIPPFAVSDLKPLLLPGETLRLHAQGRQQSEVVLVGGDDQPDPAWPWLRRLVQGLPVQNQGPQALQVTENIATPLGLYTMTLHGDVRSVNRSLTEVAGRAAWFVAAMLLAIALVWLFIEVGMIRRIAKLTRRTASLSKSVKGTGGLENFDFSALRGQDELGILASGLHDLLQRVKEDVERDRIRAEQEKDLWHAVGHEIMSPLQSLMALQGEQDSPARRYINRMLQAIRILYGSASPSEAFQSSELQVQTLDVHAFLRHVADNAPCVGIERVRLLGGDGPLWVKADEYSLEDVVTHVLRNAERYRTPGSNITMTLVPHPSQVIITIHNQGPAIAEDLLDKIFEYGVSDPTESGGHGHRGQGLFVAKTYMAKMGGTIVAQNVSDGVQLVLTLSRAA